MRAMPKASILKPNYVEWKAKIIHPGKSGKLVV